MQKRSEPCIFRISPIGTDRHRHRDLNLGTYLHLKIDENAFTFVSLPLPQIRESYFPYSRFSMLSFRWTSGSEAF